jgi:hypothetical protein
MSKLLVGFNIFLVCVVLALLPKACFGPRSHQTPTLAGQSVPNDSIKIDFNRVVDLYLKPYSGEANEPRVFKRCKIIGVIADDEGSHASSFKGYRPFENWLCVEFEDGRRAYTPKSDIEYFVDSDPPNSSKSEQGVPSNGS